MTLHSTTRIRHDWSQEEISLLFDKPFADLMLEAHIVHRQFFDPNAVQKSTLLSIKTGGCPENCGYCSQAGSAKSGVVATKLLPVEQVLADARKAQAAGAQRFCMGAAWRELKDRDLDAVCGMISGVRDLGMETCVTLGMITEAQAQRLAEAGLDYYNHNLDSSPQYYGEVVTTRTYQDRLDTLAAVRSAGLSVCCGGIIGMGETRQDRIGLLQQLATMDVHPESVPINGLVPIPGTPLGDDVLTGSRPGIDGIEFVRTICVARLLMPRSVLRLSAGREAMSEELQALCFIAGANSIFSGDRLLTTSNPAVARDEALFAKLGIVPMPNERRPCQTAAAIPVAENVQ